MVLKSKWIVVFFTTFCFNYYIHIAADDKVMEFDISKGPTNKLRCVGNPLQVTVNDRFKISVATKKNDKIHNVGQCHGNLTSSPTFARTTFEIPRGKTTFTSMYYNVTIPGKYEYKCIFYTHKCDYFDKVVCRYYYNKKSKSHSIDKGVTCTATVNVARPTPVNPRGYLTANGVNLTSSSEEYIYKYCDGENTEFACHKIDYGGYMKLLSNARGAQNSMDPILANPARMNLELRAASNDSTLECILIDDLGKIIATLTVRLIITVDEDTKGSTNWIVVVCGVLSAVLLVTVGFGVTFRLKKRKRLRKNNSSSVHFQNSSKHQSATVSLSQRDQPDDCTYAEPYSFGNPYAKVPTGHTQEHTYLNTKEPTYASVQNYEPTYAPSANGEPNYAEVHNVEPKFASVKNSGLHFASMQNAVQKTKDKTVSRKPTSQNSIEYQNIDLSCVKNKISSEIIKNRKKTSRQEKGPKRKTVKKTKSNDVTYAELCLENTKPGKFVASKVPAYSDILDLRSLNQEYENAFVNDEVEPAYCEIIPKNK